MIDFGYDISNFRAIQKEYGTMEDFERLMHEAEKLKLKIFLDFVPNHTSDQHEWFKKSMNREKGYEDYYIWHPGYVINGKRVPPSNWLSVFRGSAWTWNETRQEYYLHQFVYQQPDLNFRCAAVVKELIVSFFFNLFSFPFFMNLIKNFAGCASFLVGQTCSWFSNGCSSTYL